MIYLEIGWWETVFTTGTPWWSPPTILPVEIHLGQVFEICGFYGIVVGSNFQGSYKKARPYICRCFFSTSSYVCSSPAVHWEITALFSPDDASIYHLLKSQALPWNSDNQMLASHPPVCFKRWTWKTDLLLLLLYAEGQILWIESSLAVSYECSVSQSDCEV